MSISQDLFKELLIISSAAGKEFNLELRMQNVELKFFWEMLS